MIKTVLLLTFLNFVLIETHAQYAFFPNSGTITYERRFHVQNYLKRNYLNKADLETWDKMFVDEVVKNGPVELGTKHSLKFYDGETLFEIIKEDYPSNYRSALNYLPVFNDSKTYKNQKTNMFSRLIHFGGDEILLKDTIPNVKWKYTDEYRNIAGYDCRRANGLIQDSIYVVAFFTNQIAMPIGPELIQGLPGTILGLSVPSWNINMFATQVELNNQPVSSQLTKGKKVQPKSKVEIKELLRVSVYDWMDEKAFQKQWSKFLF
ncbi:GLPGLI family protein [Sphingobacterium faecale]|uniref:GLPGLI family protein n=1 Tax=Sphingobacterium faecale TaxID=2803775 RepID=A0ABS1R968_9SPHI|nr:GLPGLI family protein [Sphingobacterium faecale]MBL1411253.1 GLPGLI family protein [Sphingobacterium faecale]